MSKGYNLYNPQTKNVIFSRDVIFYELKYQVQDKWRSRSLQVNIDYFQEFTFIIKFNIVYIIITLVA